MYVKLFQLLSCVESKTEITVSKVMGSLCLRIDVVILQRILFSTSCPTFELPSYVDRTL